MNIDATPNQEAGKGSSLMRYPRCLRRLSACEVVNTFSFMTAMAIGEGDIPKAHYFAVKAGKMANDFGMGKYHEYSSMLDVVYAEKDIAGTYHVVEQLLKNVDSLLDFQKSKLYQHMSFREPGSSYTADIIESLLENFQYDEAFGYMKGNRDWEELIAQSS